MIVAGVLLRKLALILLTSLALGCVSASSPSSLTAIRNVTLIDPDQGATSNATILVRNDRIERVGHVDDIEIPAGARLVDGQSRYVIPGLWDMHVHAHRDRRQEFHYPLYVAHGVTTIRDAGTHLGSALAMKNSGVPHPVPAPRIIWGSPPIDGAPALLSFGLSAEDDRSARVLVRQMKTAGFDFVKVYDRLSLDAYRAVLDEAKRVGIPVDGHVPLASSPHEAVAGGQRTIEHLTLVLESCIPGALDWAHAEPTADSMALLTDGRLAASLDTYDPARCRDLFSHFRDAGTWHIPTLIQMKGAWFADDPTVGKHAGIRLVPPRVQEEWRSYRESTIPDELRAGRAVYERMLKLVGEMHRAGVRILAGTDASTEPHVVPGWSLHDELAILVEAGLSPLAALRAGSTDAARHSRPSEPIGLRAGARADLVLLRADPTIDIANSRSIDAVIINGKFLDREALDQLLKQASEAK